MEYNVLQMRYGYSTPLGLVAFAQIDDNDPSIVRVCSPFTGFGTVLGHPSLQLATDDSTWLRAKLGGALTYDGKPVWYPMLGCHSTLMAWHVIGGDGGGGVGTQFGDCVASLLH